MLMNAQSVRNKTLPINEYVREDAIDLQAIMAIWLKRDSDSALITGLTSDGYGYINVQRGGGVGLMHRDSYICQLLPSQQFEHMELLRAQLKGNKVRPFDVYVLYHPPTSDTTSGFLDELETLFTDIALSIIPSLIVGDINIALSIIPSLIVGDINIALSIIPSLIVGDINIALSIIPSLIVGDINIALSIIPSLIVGDINIALSIIPSLIVGDINIALSIIPSLIVGDINIALSIIPSLIVGDINIALSIIPSLIVGDINIHCDFPSKADKLVNMLEMFDLIQHVNVPTHTQGHILVIVISRAADQSVSSVSVNPMSN